MITIKSLTLKNFMSVGAVTQSMNFDSEELFLIIGENLDRGGNDNRNGCGKTSLLNALSYALYGKPLVSIKLENLINKTNAKNMFVCLNFEHNGVEYKIERGRKPNVFKFYVNNQELNSESTDEAQGENRLTQQEIEKVLGLSHDMFKHIVGLNTYTEPFLALGAGDQRAIIEQLLGITKLSEKAVALKEMLKTTKDEIRGEELKISAIQEANKRIEENIKGLEKRSSAWEALHRTNLSETRQAIDSLLSIDIDLEIENHKKLTRINEQKRNETLLRREIKSKEDELSKLNDVLNSLTTQSSIIEGKSCYLCGSELEDHKHEEISKKIEEQIVKSGLKIIEIEDLLKELKQEHSKIIVEKEPSVFYDTIDQAYEYRSSLEKFVAMLEKYESEVNPYVENIESLRNTGLQEVSYERINNLIKYRDHQEFLLKLLMNKDSFIRKKIINQNLAYLNKRLDYYLVKIGLPHQVEFLPDLSVEITEHGRDLDFDNLSRGERTRLILSLSWAFRDVYESLNEKINLLFIDELIDNGLDLNGVESAFSLLKKMTRDDKRSVFLISHRDELVSRADNVIKIIKEGGFTSIESSET